MLAEIGFKAPNLEVSEWVQGWPTNIDKMKGSVILVEIFQVNCPGCFLYGIPQAICIYNKYKNNEVKVLGIATAFEDYDKNTIENLRSLLTENKVIGETYRALKQYGKLVDGDKLYYKIPFPVAMDKITKMPSLISDDKIKDFMEIYFPDYRSIPENEKVELKSKIKDYLKDP